MGRCQGNIEPIKGPGTPEYHLEPPLGFFKSKGVPRYSIILLIIPPLPRRSWIQRQGLVYWALRFSSMVMSGSMHWTPVQECLHRSSYFTILRLKTKKTICPGRREVGSKLSYTMGLYKNHQWSPVVKSKNKLNYQARKQAIYKNYIHATVDKLGSIPVQNETYDVILMSNGFAPGRLNTPLFVTTIQGQIEYTGLGLRIHAFCG